MIPQKLREELSNDTFMELCIHKRFDYAAFECDGRIEWHHNFIYRRAQQNFKPFIIPLCKYHHDNLNCNFVELIMLMRFNKTPINQRLDFINIIFPRYDFIHKYNCLSNIFSDDMDRFLEIMEEFK